MVKIETGTVYRCNLGGLAKRGPSWIAFILFGSSPPPLSASCLSFSVFLCVGGRVYWWEGGGGWERNKILGGGESLALCKSFNTLCAQLPYTVHLVVMLTWSRWPDTRWDSFWGGGTSQPSALLPARIQPLKPFWKLVRTETRDGSHRHNFGENLYRIDFVSCWITVAGFLLGYRFLNPQGLAPLDFWRGGGGGWGRQS